MERHVVLAEGVNRAARAIGIVVSRIGNAMAWDRSLFRQAIKLPDEIGFPPLLEDVVLVFDFLCLDQTRLTERNTNGEGN